MCMRFGCNPQINFCHFFETVQGILSSSEDVHVIFEVTWVFQYNGNNL